MAGNKGVVGTAKKKKKKEQKKKKSVELVLGWTVDNKWAPKFWTRPGVKSSARRKFPPDPSFLISSDATEIDYHAIIVAQSGSGKSYFLGRLLEEILLQTKCRVVILDPNSDFRRFSQPVKSNLWKKAKFDPKKGGELPHEKTRRPFLRRWNDLLPVRVYASQHDQGDDLTKIEIRWLDFSIDWFSDDTDPAFQSEMRHCHAFMQDFYRLITEAKSVAWCTDRKHSVLQEARKFCEKTEGIDEIGDVYQLLRELFAEDAYGRKFEASECDTSIESLEDFHKRLEPFLDEASRRRVNFTEPVFRAYFSVAAETRTSGIFRTTNDVVPGEEPVRVHVVDLPSIDERAYRQMAVSTFLDEEWKLARRLWRRAIDLPERARDERAPTFIVVDEAHNLMPSDPDTRAAKRLRDQFRTIAAEGRKFGLFLILVSQRPDKLDPMVVSECENRAIMKMSSELVLEKAAELFGFGKAMKPKLQACLKLKPGRGLLFGPWAKKEPLKLYGAMRRTLEGGRKLSKKYWATPARTSQRKRRRKRARP